MGTSFSASDLAGLELAAHGDARALVAPHLKTKHLSIGSNASNSSAVSHGTAASRARMDISRVFRRFSDEYELDMDDVLGTGGYRTATMRFIVPTQYSHSTHITLALLTVLTHTGPAAHTRSAQWCCCRYAVVRRATHKETRKDYAVKIMSIGKKQPDKPDAEAEAEAEEGDAEQFLTYEQVINEIDLVQVGEYSCSTRG